MIAGFYAVPDRPSNEPFGTPHRKLRREERGGVIHEAPGTHPFCNRAPLPADQASGVRPVAVAREGWRLLLRIPGRTTSSDAVYSPRTFYVRVAG